MDDERAGCQPVTHRAAGTAALEMALTTVHAALLASGIMHRPTCQVALWSHYPGAGTKLAFVRVGTLDEPARLPPDIHIFTSTKAPWFELPPGARAVPEYYSSKEVWPPASLERRAALFGS
jgi:hypothetical protein